MKVKGYDAYKYREVWKIVEWRNGQVYRTERTGKYVNVDGPLPDPMHYTLTSVSTRLLVLEEFEIELWELS